MSFDLGMQRFDESGEGRPKHAGVLEEMLGATRAAIPSGGTGYFVESRGQEEFEVVLSAGSGTVCADHAAFQLDDLREPDLRVVHAIATAGDMTVIVEGGQYKAILTDPKQRERLPTDWLGEDEQTPVAASPKQLGQLIRGTFNAAKAYRQQVIAQYDTQGVNPAPWTTGGRDNRIVYVQALSKERYTKQSNKAFKFYSKDFWPKGVDLPTAGGMGGFSWSVELPLGELFYGYTTSRDHDGWARVLRAFAALEDRLIGVIEHGGSGSERFALSDGRSLSLRECTCKGLTGDD